MITLALAAALMLQPSPPPASAKAGCIRLGATTSVRYFPVNDHTILISAGLRAYRVETTPSALLTDPGAVINTRVRNSPIVCSPLELNLQVLSASGRAGLIAQSITPLSAAQAEELRRGGPRRRPR